MAFKKIPVVAAKVAGSESNFPAYIKPSALTGWGALTLAEAESIRFYSDESKINELAREITSPTEIHVKVPSLTTTTEIYADYDGIRSDYAVTDTYGRNAVWEDYYSVSHNGGAEDSTGLRTMTGQGGVISGGVSGKINLATDYDGSNDTVHTDDFITAAPLTVQFWVSPDTAASTGLYLARYDTIIGTNRSIQFFQAGGDVLFRSHSGGSNWIGRVIAGGAQTGLNLFHGTLNSTDTTSSDVKIYKNGVQADTADSNSGTYTGHGGASHRTNYAAQKQNTGVSAPLAGILDEIRLGKSERSSAWITTEYNNQNDVSSFWGTVEDAGAPAVDRSGYLVWL